MQPCNLEGFLMDLFLGNIIVSQEFSQNDIYIDSTFSFGDLTGNELRKSVFITAEYFSKQKLIYLDSD